MLQARNSGYFPLIIGIHWLTLLLMVGVYASIELREFLPKGELRSALKMWHFALGMSVFGLTALRLVIRAITKAPTIQPPLTPRVKLMATLAHIALYGLMLATPLLGWMIINGEGRQLILFGLQFPQLIAPNESLAEFIEESHVFIGQMGLLLIAAHTAATLFHHHIIKDTTLKNMAPWLRK